MIYKIVPGQVAIEKHSYHLWKPAKNQHEFDQYKSGLTQLHLLPQRNETLGE